MEHYALSLQCSPILSPLSYGSKRYENRKFHLRFKQTTLCFPQFTTSHSVTRSISHANCMNNSFSVPNSKNIERSDNILRGINGVSIVLGCVLGMFNFNSKMMNSKFNNAYAIDKSKSDYGYDLNAQPLLSGGVRSFESLWTSMKAEDIEAEIKLNSPRPSVDYMKKHALYLRKIGKIDEFEDKVDKIKKIYDDSKDVSPMERSVRLSYMELLLIKGKFDEARDLLDKEIENIVSQDNPENFTTKMRNAFISSKNLDEKKKLEEKINKLLNYYKDDEANHHDKQSIADIIFYKAIIHIMLKDKDKYWEAEKWWGAFAQTLKE